MYVYMKLVFEGLVLVRVLEGSVNVMGRKGGNRLFPTLTLTLTFHHPEQSLLHKLHWLDHVIRVGVFSARATNTNTDQSLLPDYATKGI